MLCLRKGVSLIELLIMIALLAIMLPALSLSLISSREGSVQHEKRMRAASLLQETQEALRTIREEDWTNIATNGTYHPVISGNTWDLAAGSETIDTITRQLTISNVYRDDNSQIVTSGGTLDPSTKKIDITVSWNSPVNNSLTSTLYLSRYLENAIYFQTTDSDFNSGNHTSTIVTNVNGGEVMLGSGGLGNWCDPHLEQITLDLPKNGVANALTAIEGHAFAGTGDNASGVSYAHITMTDTNPPTPSILDTIDGYKTNDVFGEAEYGYIATDDNTKEIVILRLDTGEEIGYFNASGSASAIAIYVYGTRGFMTQGSTLRIFDLSSKTGSRPQLGSVSLAGTGQSLAVSGNYVYVAIAGNTSTEMQIVNVTNPATPSVVGQANLNSQSAEDIVVNETATRAYIVTRISASQNELFVVNIESKTGNRATIGSYNANGMDPRGITLVPGNNVIIGGYNGQEYQIVSVANEASPSSCGGVDVDSGIQDIASVLESDGDAYSYILTGSSNAEFRIVTGGPGGNYASEGIYESATFEPGYSAAFNRVYPTFSQPAGTEIRFQIGVANQINNSCTGVPFTFVGPDGTTSTYYTNGEAIVFKGITAGYNNPGKCFRYRAYLSTTNSSASPVFEEISINYSP